MKILMIAPQPFFEPRGTPISVYQRLQGLSSLGYQVDLLTYHVGMDVDIPNVKIYRTPSVPFIKKVKIGPSLAKLFLDILLVIKAIILLITNRYQVIHSHEEASFFACILASLFGKLHLYDMHSSLPRQLDNFKFGNYWPIIKLFELMERYVLKTCNAVITIGADLERQVYGINPRVKQIKIENLAVHLNGSRSNRAAADRLKISLNLKDKTPVVYTGTFERYQGLDLLLASAKIVKAQQANASFILVGGRPEQITYWQNRAKADDLEDYVLFVGAVPLQEVQPYLDLAEILVSPRTGGTSVPLKVYTYLHSGKPTVATNLESHSQILHNKIALLAEPNAEAFAAGILTLMQDPKLRLTLGRQAKKFAKEMYDPANYLAKLDWIYQTLNPNIRATPEPALPPLGGGFNIEQG